MAYLQHTLQPHNIDCSSTFFHGHEYEPTHYQQIFASLGFRLWHRNIGADGQLEQYDRKRWTYAHNTHCQLATSTSLLPVSHVQRPLHMHASRRRMDRLRPQAKALTCHQPCWRTKMHIPAATPLPLRHPSSDTLRHTPLARLPIPVPGACDSVHSRRRRRHLRLDLHCRILFHRHHHRHHLWNHCRTSWYRHGLQEI